MWKTLRLATAATALASCGPAFAFMVVPAGEEPGRYVVVIETALGDHVPLSALPPPYNRLGGPAWAGESLTFRWTYFRSPEQGRAVMVFDEDDRATMTFSFLGDQLADGDTIAAAAALLDREGGAIGTVYAAGRVSGNRFENGETVHNASVLLDIAPDEWSEVTGFTFFTMKYYAIQNLDESGVAAAMRRAVERVTGGGGREQWAVGAG